MFRKSLCAALAACAIVLSAHSASASQASCIMPTTGTVSGLTLVNDINACHQALLSVYSGPTAPTLPTNGMLWFNTTTNYIQQYDGAGWNNLWFIDATNHLSTFSIGGGAVNTNLLAASTVDLGSVPQSVKQIVGTTTVNSFGSSAIVGTMHIVAFAASLTLTNSSSLLLPGGQNIQTQAGDIAFPLYIGGGIWKVLFYNYFGRSPQVAAYSWIANNTGARANPTDVSIPGLAAKGSPTGSDLVMIADVAAGNSWKQITLAQIAALTGVTSIDAKTGAFATGNGLDTLGNTIELTAARRTLPTTQVLTASSGTYTRPANVLWLELKIVGGASGGGGGNNGTLSTTGGTTCWAASGAACSSPIYASAGGAGSSMPTVGVGGFGAGGYLNTRGNSGSGGTPSSTASNGYGGSGGASCLGGGNGAGSTGAGGAADANSGSGGGGGGSSNGSISGAGGSGGSAGGCTLAIVLTPAATYTYAIGAGGAGAAGVNVSSSVGSAGAAGAAGVIVVIEHYGSWMIVFVGFRLRRRPANDNKKLRAAA